MNRKLAGITALALTSALALAGCSAGTVSGAVKG